MRSIPAHVFDESKFDHLFRVNVLSNAVFLGHFENDFEVAQVLDHHGNGDVVEGDHFDGCCQRDRCLERKTEVRTVPRDRQNGHYLYRFPFA